MKQESGTLFRGPLVAEDLAIVKWPLFECAFFFKKK